MKILVTGGAGYIGGVTCEELVKAGHEVVIFDNLEYGHRETLLPAVSLYKGDLRDAESIRSAIKQVRPEAVIHFAAYALVGESMAHPERYFENNVAGGINLANAMLEAGIKRLVFSSTCATYGEPETDLISETTPQNPTNPYGLSKLMFEQVLQSYAEVHDFHPVFLRYFNACGATERLGEDHTPESHLIPLVLQVALGQREAITIFGDDYDTPDGSCVRDYIHVEDLAKAHILALEAEHKGPFNLGTGKGVSVREVIESARRVTGHAIPVIEGERRAGDPASLVASADKARELLGWQAKHTDLDEIITSAWKWHQEHPNGYQK